jgi:lysophospholipase L1-like esterase
MATAGAKKERVTGSAAPPETLVDAVAGAESTMLDSLNDKPAAVSAAWVVRPAAIDDLYAVAKPVTETIGRPNDVHFAPAGYSLLVKAVAESIAAQLPR